MRLLEEIVCRLLTCFFEFRRAEIERKRLLLKFLSCSAEPKGLIASQPRVEKPEWRNTSDA